jgi:rhodanese-related sulfurtransferase
MKRIMMVSLSLGLLLFGVLAAGAANVPRMDKDQLKALLGKPELALVDVRSGSDWKESTQKIAGAVREDPDQVETWMNKYPKDKTLVFYCA